MINLLKKYLYISLGVHVFIFIAGLIISSGNSIKQPFVVFGAHSKKEYHTLYKARNSIIPFMGHGSAGSGTGKSGNGSGKSGSGKKRSGKSAHSNSSKNKKSKISEQLEVKSSKQGKLAGKKPKASSKKQQLTEPLEKSKKQKRKELEEEKKIEEELKKIELEAQKEMDQEIEAEKKREAEKREAEKQKELEKEIEKKEQEAAQVKAAKQEPEVTEDTNDDQDDQPDQDDQGGEVVEEQNGGAQEEFVFTLGNMDGSQAAYSRHIQSETGRLWKPPLGVPKGTSCKVKFIIGKDGKVEDFQTIQKSDVIIYDLSILRVAHLFKFDRCLWGKSFVIDFRQ